MYIQTSSKLESVLWKKKGSLLHFRIQIPITFQVQSMHAHHHTKIIFAHVRNKEQQKDTDPFDALKYPLI